MGIGSNLQQVLNNRYLFPLSVVHALFTLMFVNNTLSLGHYSLHHYVNVCYLFIKLEPVKQIKRF